MNNYIHTSIYYNLIDKTYDNNIKYSSVISSYINKILDIIPEEYNKTLLGISLKATATNSYLLLIFHTSRDQRARYKKLAESITEKLDNIISFYVKLEDKLIHIEGNKAIPDRINHVHFKISPYSPVRTIGQGTFYKKILDVSPTGRTRNAIVIDSHFGIISMHLSERFNRLYCIDNCERAVKEAKWNYRDNRINNCLAFENDPEKWLYEFKNGKHTPPGKKPNIGLLIANTELVKNNFQTILDIRPESIVFFSEKEFLSKEDETLFNDASFRTTFSVQAEQFKITKLKRKDNE